MSPRTVQFLSTELTLLDMCSDFVLLLDPVDGKLRHGNRAFQQWFEVSSPSAMPEGAARIMSQLVATSEFQQLAAAQGQHPAEVETQLELRIQDLGERYRVKLKWLPGVRTSEGESACVAAVIQNPQGSWGAQSDSNHCDPLTGLPNRERLIGRLEDLIQGERSTDNNFALLFIDLDDFKPINDRWGHMVGDEVLGEVAHRLSDCIRQDDMLVRFGGDEFVALLEHVAHESEYEPVIERLRAALESPVETASGIVAAVSISIGAIDSRSFQGTSRDFLDAADRAMYRAKRRRLVEHETHGTSEPGRFAS